ncbi:MAG: hypothetical protein MHM6MM_002984 [Cercozoa sp. M6MM]
MSKQTKRGAQEAPAERGVEDVNVAEMIGLRVKEEHEIVYMDDLNAPEARKFPDAMFQHQSFAHLLTKCYAALHLPVIINPPAWRQMLHRLLPRHSDPTLWQDDTPGSFLALSLARHGFCDLPRAMVWTTAAYIGSFKLLKNTPYRNFCHLIGVSTFCALNWLVKPVLDRAVVNQLVDGDFFLAALYRANLRAALEYTSTPLLVRLSRKQRARITDDFQGERAIHVKLAQMAQDDADWVASHHDYALKWLATAKPL